MSRMSATATRRPVRRTRSSIDWAREVRLAIVLSIAAAVAAATLSGHVAERSIVVGVIVVASLVAWHRVEPLAESRSLR